MKYTDTENPVLHYCEIRKINYLSLTMWPGWSKSSLDWWLVMILFPLALKLFPVWRITLTLMFHLQLRIETVETRLVFSCYRVHISRIILSPALLRPCYCWSLICKYKVFNIKVFLQNFLYQLEWISFYIVFRSLLDRRYIVLQVQIKSSIAKEDQYRLCCTL